MKKCVLVGKRIGYDGILHGAPPQEKMNSVSLKGMEKADMT